MTSSPAPAFVLAAAIIGTLALTSCKEEQAPPPATTPQTPAAAVTPDPKAAGEIPLLAIKKGDFWRYVVQVEVTSQDQPDSPPQITRHETTRTFLGKIKPAADKPEVDAFEVVVPNTPTERELVEIYDDRILMRGSIRITDGVASPPMWLEPPVPFVLSNIRTGSSMPALSVAEGERTRGIFVVGREDVTVPAGTFRAIRLLMTGKDLELEMRRTIWFAPGVGIVKELNTRYTKEIMLLRQTQELVETSVKKG